MNEFLASTALQYAGVFLFFAGLVAALVCFIWGIVVACSQQPRKWAKALLIGVGLTLVALGIAFGGCAAWISYP